MSEYWDRHFTLLFVSGKGSTAIEDKWQNGSHSGDSINGENAPCAKCVIPVQGVRGELLGELRGAVLPDSPPGVIDVAPRRDVPSRFGLISDNCPESVRSILVDPQGGE